MTFPVTAAADDLRTQRPGGIHERHRAEPDERKAVSRQELPLPVRTRRGGEAGRRPTPRDHPRRVGRLPTMQRRRDRRGTQAVKACAIITSQPSQVAVTAVVTVGEHRPATESHGAVSHRFVGPDLAGRSESLQECSAPGEGGLRAGYLVQPGRSRGVKTERGSAGEEDLEGVGGGTQEQLTVSKTSPGLLLDGTNVVASQFVHQLPRQLLIEQDAHGPSVLRGRLRGRPPPARARR